LDAKFAGTPNFVDPGLFQGSSVLGCNEKFIHKFFEQTNLVRIFCVEKFMCKNYKFYRGMTLTYASQLFSSEIDKSQIFQKLRGTIKYTLFSSYLV